MRLGLCCLLMKGKSDEECGGKKNSCACIRLLRNTSCSATFMNSSGVFLTATDMGKIIFIVIKTDEGFGNDAWLLAKRLACADLCLHDMS